jgi:hypothetical protein
LIDLRFRRTALAGVILITVVAALSTKLTAEEVGRLEEPYTAHSVLGFR